MSYAAKIFTRRHHRRRHFFGFLALALLVIWVIIWGLSALHMNQMLDQLIAQSEKEGIKVTYSKRFTNGNPFSIHTHLDPLHIRLKNGNEIKAQESVFYLKLWDWNKVSGKLRDGINATIMDTKLHAGIVRFGFTKPKATTNQSDPYLNLWLQPLGVTFEEEIQFALGNIMDEALLNMRIIGHTPNFNAPESLAAWRDAGGRIEFDELFLNWGPLQVTSRGNIALDDKLQPQGAFAGRVKGLDETIGMLALRQKLDNNQLSMLRATMGVLARPVSMTGGSSSSTLPVTLHGGQLYFGPVKLMALPIIKWN